MIRFLIRAAVGFVVGLFFCLTVLGFVLAFAL